MTLTDIIAILEAADGPDRKIDRLISVYDPGPKPEISSWNYTDSVDRAIALAEKVLPGWFWRCGATPLFPNGWAHVSRYDASNCDRRDEGSCSNGKAATPAIALCIATLRALSKQGDRT